MLFTTSVKRSTALRLLLSSFAGFMAGLYFEGAFLPRSVYLWIIAGSACSLAALFTAGLPSISAKNAVLFQGIFTLFIGVLPVTYMLQPSLLKNIRASHRAEAVSAHRVGLCGLYAAVCTITAVVIKYFVASREQGGAPSSRPQAGSLGRSKLQASIASANSQLHWIASVGNVCATLAFGLAVHINISYLEGNDSAVFCLVPLLLLLSRDNGLFSKLTDSKRYFPLVVVSLGYLTSSAVFQLVVRGALEKHSLIHKQAGHRPEVASAFAVLRNLFSLAVTIPGHWMFANFMWSFRHTRDIYWVLLLPLNFLPIFMSDLPSVRLLGALGIAEGCMQLFLSNRIKRHGMQFV